MFGKIKEKILRAWKWLKADKTTWKNRLVKIGFIGLCFAAGDNVIPDTAILKINAKYFIASQEIKSKYNLNGSSLRTLKLEKNDLSIEIGDSKKGFIEPNLTLDRWGEKIKVKPDYVYNEADKKFDFDGNKIKFGNKNEDIEYVFYDINPTSTLPDGGYEFEIVLLKKPATSTFITYIESGNIEFLFQGSLIGSEINGETCTDTQCTKDGQITAQRPENVVNSYALYHREATNDFSNLGGYNYRSGKFGHIYRIKCIDANENWIWGEQKIKNYGSIYKWEKTCDDNWLNKIAKYPVRIDPTFGYTTAGSSYTNSSGLFAGGFVAPRNGTTTQIVSYTATLSSTANGRNAIYDQISGQPKNLLVQASANHTIDTTPTWRADNISLSISEGNTYWLATWAGSNRLFYSDTYYDQQIEKLCNNPGTSFPTFPADFGNPGTIYSYYKIMSIYAVYNAEPNSKFIRYYDYNNSATGTYYLAWKGLLNQTSTPTFDTSIYTSNAWIYATPTVFTAYDYSLIQSDNGTYATTSPTSTPFSIATSTLTWYWPRSAQKYQFCIDDNPKQFKDWTWEWKGYVTGWATSSATTTKAQRVAMYVYDQNSNIYRMVDEALNASCMNTECTLEYSTTSNSGNNKLMNFFFSSTTAGVTRYCSDFVVAGTEAWSDCRQNAWGNSLTCEKFWYDTLDGTSTAIGCQPQTDSEDLWDQCPEPTESVPLGCRTGYCGGFGETFELNPYACNWYYDGAQHSCPTCYGCPSSFNPTQTVCEAKSTSWNATPDYGCGGPCNYCGAGTCLIVADGQTGGCTGGQVCMSGICADPPAGCETACGPGNNSCRTNGQQMQCVIDGGAPDGNDSSCSVPNFCCCGA